MSPMHAHHVWTLREDWDSLGLAAYLADLPGLAFAAAASPAAGAGAWPAVTNTGQCGVRHASKCSSSIQLQLLCSQACLQTEHPTRPNSAMYGLSRRACIAQASRVLISACTACFEEVTSLNPQSAAVQGPHLLLLHIYRSKPEQADLL